MLTRDRDGRVACTYLGRCLRGCPRQALYTPPLTLAECRRHPGFVYAGGLLVNHLRVDRRGRLTAAVAVPVEGGPPQELPAERFVLAAGALGSSAIYLRTVREATGEAVVLEGLMDNRQVVVPFLTPALAACSRTCGWRTVPSCPRCPPRT